METRTYDKAGNLVAIKDVKKDGTVINDYTYSYDQGGNITAITDRSAGTKVQQTATDSNVHMEYDSVNRLIKYNGKEVRYDADGNMVYGPLDGEMATFTYDCRNRLIQVTTDSGKTTNYVYDAENVRTKVIKNVGMQSESTTTYLTDSTSNELSRVLKATTADKAGNTETILYTYGNGLVAQEKGTEYLLYHFNHLGSTTAVTDETGGIKYTYTYSIFGKLLNGNYGDVEFLYNGQYGVASDANGLYYMRARYYNIDIMRFINQDILTGSIDSSQSLNRYAYVEGNPVNFLDPFGLDEMLYEELHNWISGIKSYVSLQGILDTVGELITGKKEIVFKDGSKYPIGAKKNLTLGNVLSIGKFIANTALTWFDIGVYINEWICAAWQSDADKMIEINRKVAASAAIYAIDAMFFAVDFYYTGGWLSTGFSIVNELLY